ncbi:Crp/Fnr family transcriptional regulator [Terrarubrum flagellatum]|uniref:Crp/Fnr family transcriptional regulator n=1 Tax=Terrirubrum flagellatum TaxID=2895980 RepID=UPI003144F683
MTQDSGVACGVKRVPCSECALRQLPIFTKVSPEELATIANIKREDRLVKAGETIVRPGEENAELFTLYRGWAFRYRTLSDSRRQILHFALPGDLIGLQSALFEAAQYGVEALTDIHLCVLPRREVWKLFGAMPQLAFDLTWLGAREESLVDEGMLTVGRRTADERVASLLIGLFKRARALGLATGNIVNLPLTQQHIADALGLSLVHTNKTLSRLRRYGLYARKGTQFEMLNIRALERLSEFADRELRPRPLM